MKAGALTMATTTPPSVPPSAPPPNPHHNDTVLAVVIGIVLVVAGMITLGVFVIHNLVEHTQIVENSAGGQDAVEIHSPLGDLKANGRGANGDVNIRSPFGSLSVNSNPDLAALGMAIYPGATQVTTRQGSPFHMHDYDSDSDLHDANDATSAHVEIRSGNAGISVNVAEFETTASEDQVLDFYRQQLGETGSVEQRQERDGATSLRVRFSRQSLRQAVVKTGNDGRTHFVLVRVRGGDTEK